MYIYIYIESDHPSQPPSDSLFHPSQVWPLLSKAASIGRTWDKSATSWEEILGRRWDDHPTCDLWVYRKPLLIFVLWILDEITTGFFHILKSWLVKSSFTDIGETQRHSKRCVVFLPDPCSFWWALIFEIKILESLKSPPILDLVKV